MENTLKDDKGIWKMRQEYLLYGEYANRYKIELISGNFRPKPKKILIQNLSPNMIEWATKPSLATAPLSPD
jgi:hypothetical protein